MRSYLFNRWRNFDGCPTVKKSYPTSAGERPKHFQCHRIGQCVSYTNRRWFSIPPPTTFPPSIQVRATWRSLWCTQIVELAIWYVGNVFIFLIFESKNFKQGFGDL